MKFFKAGGSFLKSIDFNLINTPLTYCRNKTFYRLEDLQNTGQSTTLISISRLFLQVSNNNLDAIRALIVKDYKFSAPANVICRSSMDMVFSICLMFSKSEKYVEMYDKSGWREKYEHLQIEKDSEFMQQNGSDWLNVFEEFLDNLKVQIGISQEEIEDLHKLLVYFPTAPQIMNKRFNYYKDLDEVTSNLFRCLLKDFYHSLSQISHVSSTGLARHAAPLIQDFSLEKQTIIKSQPVATAMLCQLIIMSEICIKFETNINQKLREVWTYLSMTIPIHNDVYMAKYSKVL